MKKYVKYIILVILAIICLFLIWYTFLRKNNKLVELEKNFDNKVETTNEQNSNLNTKNEYITGDNNATNIDENNVISSNEENIIDKNTIKIDDKNKDTVIISSDSKMLNEQGKELLKELSAELEKSFSTIEKTTGVVDENILDSNSEIKIEE